MQLLHGLFEESLAGVKQRCETVARRYELPCGAKAGEAFQPRFTRCAKRPAPKPAIRLSDQHLPLTLKSIGPGIGVPIFNLAGHIIGLPRRKATGGPPAQSSQEKEVHIGIFETIALAQARRGIVDPRFVMVGHHHSPICYRREPHSLDGR